MDNLILGFIFGWYIAIGMVYIIIIAKNKE